MTLRLSERRPGPGDDRLWVPFDDTDGFTTHWWNRLQRTGSTDYVHLSVVDGDTEVARVELDNGVHIDAYRNLPILVASPLEIQFIEVRASHRLRGLGRAVVELLAREHPDRTLLAFSEEADGFWDSLGWTRHIHEEDNEPDPRHRPLYIQPQPGSLDH